ncbi:dnaJ C terminal domain protein [Mycobacterium xenopi 4042]|uniref:Chaperone protein DnaJ n=1 Tax=Mycobacterium xenopi 4042 TaxID=1299334 RepID=X8DM77_MYCXE|nr:dnaJ C terminal domain protein [Mycobacterium xenopi 4042]
MSEAHSVLSDPAKRKEYDETRRLFAGSGGSAAASAGQLRWFRHGRRRRRVQPQRFVRRRKPNRRQHHRRPVRGLFGRGASPRPSRPRRGNDLETEAELSFVEAAKGVAMPLRLTSPAPCTNCHGSGARPGTSPRVCPICNGTGVISRNQGAFGFSEPCTDCRGSGSIIEHPCSQCKGTGVTTRTRTINVRIPPGVEDGQRIRLPGQGEAGLRGAPSGDLYVTVHVRPDPVFGREGDDLTVTVPVSFSELALGTTLSVPTLDGRVGVRVPKGTADGRILRIRGRGIPKRGGGSGDLLVTVKVAVPPNLDGAAKEALEAYAAAERASGFDPRAGWAGNR